MAITTSSVPDFVSKSNDVLTIAPWLVSHINKYTVTVTVTETITNTVVATPFVITVPGANSPPLLVGILSDVVLIAQDGFVTQIPSIAFSDPEGETLTISLAMTDGTLPTFFALDSASWKLTSSASLNNVG